ncbi:MAG: sugar ABC transporter permease, partial [Clostridiales bacterium]|nr:sugar ABC transporter permease [Clostridiales bacterium]
MRKIFSHLKFSREDITPERKKAGLYALASAALAGLGYVLQKNFIKGFIYMAVELAFILLFVFWGGSAINGFATLGTTSMKDHSLVLMVYGILAIIILGAFVCFWISNISGTYRSAYKLFKGEAEEKDVKKAFKDWLHDRTALLFLAPGLVAVALGILLPLVFSICIAFTDYDAGHQPPLHILNWVGLKNFQDLLVLGQYAKTFFGILGWTVIWTVCSSVFPYALGILLAVILNNPNLRGKKIFKFIYILPWAIPGYISLLVLQSMFDTGYGLINQIFELFGIPGVPWLTSTTPARIALILVSIWTGFSFPMMLSENIIKYIPNEVTEAERLDGASS